MKKYISYLILPLLSTALIILVYIIELLPGLDFTDSGILPRTLSGLKGILFAPFIHGSWTHLMSNMSVYPVLMILLTIVYRHNYVRIYITLYLLTGLLVWIFARPSYHIGASGVIYALASFLFFGGLISKRFGAIAISLLIVLLYGGMVWGIFPGEPHVSWESHALGGVAGFITAMIFLKEHPKRKSQDSDFDYNAPGFGNSNSTNNYDSANYSYRKL